MSDLSKKKCIPCSEGAPPLKEDEVQKLQKSIDEAWRVEDNKQLIRTFKLSNFKEALDLTNKIGAIAEEEGHHPDLQLSWGKVIVTLWTHKIKGLHENDFILAAKIDQLTK